MNTMGMDHDNTVLSYIRSRNNIDKPIIVYWGEECLVFNKHTPSGLVIERGCPSGKTSPSLPAIITSSVLRWYKNDKLHNTNGPAFIEEFCRGFKSYYYYINGNRLLKEDWEIQRKMIRHI